MLVVYVNALERSALVIVLALEIFVLLAESVVALAVTSPRGGSVNPG